MENIYKLAIVTHLAIKVNKDTQGLYKYTFINKQDTFGHCSRHISTYIPMQS